MNNHLFNINQKLVFKSNTFNHSVEISKSSASIERYLNVEKDPNLKVKIKSLTTYLQEQNRSQRSAFNMRIKEFRNYVNKTPNEKLEKEVDILKNYILQPLKNFIEYWVSNESMAIPNIIMNFGLSNYIKGTGLNSARKVQQILLRAKKLLLKKGTISESVQKELWQQYDDMIYNLFDTILSSIREDKKIIFMGGSTNG